MSSTPATNNMTFKEARAIQHRLDHYLRDMQSKGLLSLTAVDHIRDIAAEGIAEYFGERYRVFPTAGPDENVHILRDRPVPSCVLETLKDCTHNPDCGKPKPKAKGEPSSSKNGHNAHLDVLGAGTKQWEELLSNPTLLSQRVAKAMSAHTRSVAPVAKHAPVALRAPVAELAPAAKVAPAADQVSVAPRTPVAELAPTAKVAPVASQASVAERAPAAKVVPIADQASAAKHAPVTASAGPQTPTHHSRSSSPNLISFSP